MRKDKFDTEDCNEGMIYITFCFPQTSSPGGQFKSKFDTDGVGLRGISGCLHKGAEWVNAALHQIMCQPIFDSEVP